MSLTTDPMSASPVYDFLSFEPIQEDEDKGSYERVTGVARAAGLTVQDSHAYDQQYQSWNTSNLLGAGAKGSVYAIKPKKTTKGFIARICARWNKSNQPCVAKVITDPQHVESGVKECQTLNLLNRKPMVLGIYCMPDKTAPLVIIQRQVKGTNLFSFVNSNSITDAQAKSIFKALLKAVTAMHEQKVFHRDLSERNIMIHVVNAKTNTYKVEVIDFGEAHATTQDENDTLRSSVHGTWAYMAPELTQGDYSCPKADMWSLGVVLYRMLTKEYPFGKTPIDHMSIKRLKSAHNSCPLTDHHFRVLKQANSSPLAIDLLQNLLTIDFSKRLSSAEALSHPWLCHYKPPVHEVLMSYSFHP